MPIVALQASGEAALSAIQRVPLLGQKKKASLQAMAFIVRRTFAHTAEYVLQRIFGGMGENPHQ